MSAQGTAKPDLVKSAATAASTLRAGAYIRPWLEARKQAFSVGLLMTSDLLFALFMWQAAFIPQAIWGSGVPSEAAAVSILPNLVVWIGLCAILGLYPGYGLGQVEELRRQTFAVFGTIMIASVFAFAAQATSLSRMLLFVWACGLLLTAPLTRCLVKSAMRKCGLWGKPVVVLGAREPGAEVIRSLKREWHLGFIPVSVFDNRVVPTDEILEGVPYGGTLTEAIAMSRRGLVDTAIFALPHTRRQHLARYVDLASNTFQHIVVIPNLGGITNSGVVARDLAGTFGVEIKLNLLDIRAQRIKRCIDLFASVIGGLAILPLMCFLALLVWIESGGSIFYRDYRMGRDGRMFSCIKFRTMVPDAENLLRKLLSENEVMRTEYQKYHKLRNDPRITRVGKFLRKTSMDELPQIWHVIRGDMSLIGPRPYLPRESVDIGDTQSEILRVAPGITGPWQVSGRNHTSFSERVEIDARYVRDWSVWLDIVILARTVKCLCRNAY